MSKLQYTIRNVPPEVDNSLRLRARKNKQSFNATLVDALRQSTSGKTAKPPKGEFDWLYGSGGIGEAELKAFKDQRKIDKESWNLPG
ncbi:MAG: FitA-like ribbon-helix-helix domain-containing protein [Candidatus Saccharimonadales bacterium]